MATPWEGAGLVLYYMAWENQRLGPFPMEELLARGVRPHTLVWCQGMSDWLPAGQVPELQAAVSAQPPVEPPPFASSAALNYAGPPPFDRLDVNSKKTAAGICAIFLGSLGVHKFILGLTAPAIIMLVLTIATCGVAGIVMHVISVIEGIIYLSCSDQEFYQRYIVEKKGWF